MKFGTEVRMLREKLIAEINAAKLPPVVVELILQNLLAEAHALAEMQIKAEAAQDTEEATDGK